MTENRYDQSEQHAAGQDTPEQSSRGFAAAQLDDIESLSYEQAREELIAVVTKLETGGAPLEESLALWQRGEALADRCERWLDGAKARLDEVRENLSGTAEDAGQQ